MGIHVREYQKSSSYIQLGPYPADLASEAYSPRLTYSEPRIKYRSTRRTGNLFTLKINELRSCEYLFSDLGNFRVF